MSQNHELEFTNLINHLQEVIGKDKIEKINNNIYRTIIHDKKLSLLNKEGELIIISYFSNLNNYSEKEKIKNYLLKANCLYMGSNGGAYAIDSFHTISYAYQSPLSLLDNDSFIYTIESFLINIDDCLEKFETLSRQKSYSNEIQTSINQENEEQFLIPQNWQKI